MRPLYRRLRRFIALTELIINTEWDRGGGWITHEGTVELCNPTVNRFHFEIILEYFGQHIQINDLGDYDGESSETAHEIAYDAGWIRIMTRGDRSLCINWDRKPSSETKSALIQYLLKNLTPYFNYELDADGEYHQFDNLKSLIWAVKRLA